MAGCGSAQPRPWSLLCQAHRLVTTHHIDSPDGSSLAAAAATGVRRFVRTAEDTPSDTADRFDCYLPDRAYESVCEAIADRHREGGGDIDDLVEAAVLGMFRFGLDPYSSYLVPDFAERLGELGPGPVHSIGLVVGAREASGQVCGPLSEACRLLVLAVFDFTPAAAAGVLVGDVIAAIDGSSVDGLAESEAIAALHASAGVTTTVTIVRESTTVDRSLVHEDLRPASVEYGMASELTAYLRINDFSQEAAQAVGQILRTSEFETAQGLILDLRGNPGGLVLSAQAVASQFLRDGIVLVEETRAGMIELPVIAGGLANPAMRVVVIVDGGTASAGEVVAAALQARDRAEVIGESTFGKNLVQEAFTAPGGGEFRITVARWTGPGGVDVGAGGLQPDVVVASPPGDDAILETALAMLEG
jgi:carboxyl-terminal processing protease